MTLEIPPEEPEPLFSITKENPFRCSTDTEYVVISKSMSESRAKKLLSRLPNEEK